MSQSIIMVANGDLRLSANQACWAAQARFAFPSTGRDGPEGLRKPGAGY